MKEKITLKIEDVESFFKRARKIARRADHGEPLRKRITFSFEEIKALESFISSTNKSKESNELSEQRPKPRSVGD